MYRANFDERIEKYSSKHSRTALAVSTSFSSNDFVYDLQASLSIKCLWPGKL